MSETISTLDKRLVVCPLSERLGYGQNYRVTERPNRGHLESRPVKGTDAFADAFFKALHADKGTPVEVTDSRGETVTIPGFGMPDAQALRFSMKAGMQARQRYVERVNKGEIKAPRKNWDKTFVPERTVTWHNAKTGEDFSYQIGGGIPIDELKEKYPELYGTRTSSKRSDESAGVLDDLDGDVLETLGDEEEPQRRMSEVAGKALTRPDEQDELESMADEIDGNDAYGDEEEEIPEAEIPSESYAATATAEDVLEEESTTTDDAVDDDVFEDNTREGESAAQASAEGRLSGAAAARHEKKEETGSGRIEKFDAPRTKSHQDTDMTTMRVRRPETVTAVKTLAIKWMDEEGKEHTSYKVKHPNTGEVIWIEAGTSLIEDATIQLVVV